MRIFAILMLLPSMAFAQNPLAVGDFVVPFRDMVNGVVVNTPKVGIKDTCWRVTGVSATSVSVSLEAGVYRPHYEDKTYTEHKDEFAIGDFAPFPTDVKAREFSIFKRVEACDVYKK